MKIKIHLLALFLLLTPSIYSQEQRVVITNTTKHDARIDVNKPTVYLSFERYDGDKFVWLRLYNNSRWAINFNTDDYFGGLLKDASTWKRDEFGLLDNAKVKPKYVVERLLEGRVDNLGCVRSESWLPSGRSVVFEIPRDHLPKYSILYISFAYEWETEGFEPEHRVKFYGSDQAEASR